MTDKMYATSAPGLIKTSTELNQDLVPSPLTACEKQYVNDGFDHDESQDEPKQNVVIESEFEGNLVAQPTSSDRQTVVIEQEKTVAPDGGWGWVVCFACFMECMIFDGTTYTFGIIFLDLTETFNSDKGSGAWISSLAFGICLAFGPFVSVLCDRIGLRMVAITGSITACCGLVLSSFAQSIQFLYFSYGIVLGFGYGMMYQTSIISVTLYFTKKRTFATGLSLCGMGFGVFAMSPLTEWLIQTYSWRGTFLIQGGLLLNGVLCGLVYRPLISTFTNKKSRQDETKSTVKLSEPPISLTNEKQDEVKNEINPSEIRKAATTDTLTNEKEILNITSLDLPTNVSTSTNNTSRERNKLPDSSENCNTFTSVCKESLNISSDDYYIQVDNNFNITKRPKEQRTNKKYCANAATDTDVATDSFIRRVFNVVSEVFDMSLLKDWKFSLYVVSSSLFQFSLFIPFIYLPDLAIHAGIDPTYSAWLLSAVGITNIVSRVLFSMLSDRLQVNRFVVYSVCLFVSGMTVLAKPFFHSFEGLLTLSIIFGLFEGLGYIFISVLIPDLVGTKNMAKGFGIRNMFAGISTFLGTPVAGWLFDLTGSYSVSFYVFGATMALSGAMLFVIPCTKYFHQTKTYQNGANHG